MKLRPMIAAALLAALTACAATHAPAPGAPATKPPSAPAPVMVGADILAEVPAQDAWALLTNVEHWSDWNRQLTRTALAGGLTVGAQVSYSNDGKDVSAAIEELQDGSVLVWKGARVGRGVRMHWMVKDMGGHCLVSLRAELKPNASQELIGQAGSEASEWMTAIQAELGRHAAALKAAQPAPAPAKSKKRHHKAAAPTAASTAAPAQ